MQQKERENFFNNKTSQKKNRGVVYMRWLVKFMFFKKATKFDNVSYSILTQMKIQKGFEPIVLEFDDRHVCVKKSQQQ